MFCLDTSFISCEYFIAVPKRTKTELPTDCKKNFSISDSNKEDPRPYTSTGKFFITVEDYRMVSTSKKSVDSDCPDEKGLLMSTVLLLVRVMPKVFVLKAGW